MLSSLDEQQQQQQEEEEDGSDSPVFFISVALLTIGLFAASAAVFAYVAKKFFYRWWLYRHGHHTEATIHAKRVACIRSFPEDNEKPTQRQATMGSVRLIYTVPRTEYESIVSASDGLEEEWTIVENPKWIVLPHAMRDKAPNDTIRIVVHPTDPLKVLYHRDLCFVLYQMTCFFPAFLALPIFLAYAGCLTIDDLDIPNLPHAREACMALLLSIDTGIFVYFVRQVQARWRQHPIDDYTYAAVVVFREASSDPKYEDEPEGYTKKETVLHYLMDAGGIKLY